MGLLQKISAMLRGGTSGFMPLEIGILQETGRQLDNQRREKLQQRIDRVNLVQRLDGGREVNIYEMQNGKPVIDSSLRLTDKNGEIVLAEFAVTNDDGMTNRGKLWLVDGRLFSLEFEDSTEHMLDVSPKEVSVRLVS